MYFFKKQTIDNQVKIDIRDLKRKGFKYGLECTGIISVNVNNVIINSVSFAINDKMLTLEYSCENNRQQIDLDWLQCNYGNQRAYFICPQCGRRVISLYMSNKYFYCRKCCNFTYRSQQEDEASRLIRKIRRIRQKLNASDELFGIIWHKPKGMHHKTFYRLVEEDNVTAKQYFNRLLTISRGR